MLLLKYNMPTILRLKDIKKKEPKENISQKYYNNKGWRILRNSYIRKHPLCEICLSKGIVKPAEEVHHKQFILSGCSEAERIQLLTSEQNLLSVCKECHNKLHVYAKKYHMNYADHYD